MPLKDWNDLTAENIATIKKIFEGSAFSPETRASLLITAERMVREQKFTSPSRRWNAVHNTLKILVQGTAA